MPDPFNPYRPHVVGLELGAAQAHRSPREFIVTPSDALVFVNSVDAVEAGLTTPHVALDPRRRGIDTMPLLGLDCYADVDGPYRWAEAEWERLPPSLATPTIFGVSSEAGTAPALYHTSLDPATTDALLIGDGPGGGVDLAFNLVDSIAAGRRIRDVRLRVRMSRNPGTTEALRATCILTGALIQGGSLYFDDIRLGQGDTIAETFLYPLGEQYPGKVAHLVTPGPGVWTPTSLAKFNSTAVAPIVSISLGAGISTVKALRVESVVLEVLHTTEDRLWALVVRGTPPAASGPVWFPTSPIGPTFGSTYTKDGAHTWVLRGMTRAGGGVTSAIVPMLAGDGPDIMGTNVVSRAVDLGRVRPLETAKPQDLLISTIPRVFGFMLRNAAGTAPSADDTYGVADVRRVRVINGTTAKVVAPLGAVATGPPSYYLISLVVAAEERPTNNLTVEIRNRGTSALVGTWSFTPADWDAGVDVGSGANWKRVTVAHAVLGVNLVAATAYDLWITSTTINPRVPWSVQLIRSLPFSTGATVIDPALATYGETAPLTATVGGVADPMDGDVSGWISLNPPVVTAFAAASSSQAIAARGLDCDLTGIPRARLTWVRPAVDAAYDAIFRWYEIQRRDVGGTWEVVARLTAVATQTWDDYECRIGVAQEYRIRTVRAIDAKGTWVTLGGAGTVTVADTGTGYTFTTNQNPALNVGYVDLADVRTGRTFDHLNAGHVEWREMMGRDFAVKFSPGEDRGVAMDRVVAVAALGAATRTDTVLDALDEIADRTSLPYVCVRDDTGGRWYCGLVVTRSQVVGTSQLTTATVTIRQVAGEPEPDDT